MVKQRALAFLTAAPILILIVFLLDAPGASWVLATLVMGFPIALVALAVSRGGSLGRLRLPLWTLLAMLQAGGMGVLLFSESSVAGLWGLPLSLHFLLLLVWLAPLGVTTLAYAWLFSELAIDDALLERLRRMRQERQVNETRR